MSTRATVTVKDESDTFHIYTHGDGYPSYQAKRIKKAIAYAWPLPRFEAMDFAAAFVAANKEKGGGNVYLTTDAKLHDDREYHYDITESEGALMVTIREFHGKPKVLFSGTYADLMQNEVIAA